MFKITNFALLITGTLIASNTTAKTPDTQTKDYPFTLTRPEYLLEVCLDYNYEKLGAYKASDLKDFSTLKENNKVEMPYNSVLIFRYVEKNANFYNDDYSAFFSSYEVSKPPYNAIFARCINFSKSKSSKKFLDSLPIEKKFTD